MKKEDLALFAENVNINNKLEELLDRQENIKEQAEYVKSEIKKDTSDSYFCYGISFVIIILIYFIIF